MKTSLQNSNLKIGLKSILLISITCLNSLLIAQTVTFTTPGATTWTVPPCVTSITVQVWSGGGGGGGSISILRNSSDGEACSGAGGGGGGGYTSQTFAVTSGQVYNVVVGAGGTAGTAGSGTWNGGITTAPGTGGTGGTSSFMNFGINMVATGGVGGNGAGAYNNNNPPDVNATGTPGLGGVGSGGTVFYNGGSGAAGYVLWTGTDKSGGGGGAAGPGGSGGNAPAGNSYGIIDNNPGGLGSAPGGNGGNSRMNNLPSNSSKNGGNGNLIGAGGGGGLNHKEGYGVVSATGGAGARGEVRITYSSPVLPATPTISSTAPTCVTSGSSTISNYNAGYTYTFTPAGPTVGAGGVISGMVVGTNYTATANNGSCNSSASISFSNGAILSTPTIPTLNSTAPTCSAAGTSTVSNYNAGYTYTFTPAGPTVGAGGVISGLVVGTTYQVSASNGSCSSSNSVDFSIAAILPSPTTPNLSSTAPTCSAAGSSTVSNYNAGYTYTFTPAGPTVGAGGVISGMVVGTNYTATANNGSCNSSASVSFSNGAILPTPTIPTLNSTAPTCSAAGTGTVSNYNAGYTYTFTPAGPTVGAGGVISGLVVGTTYQVSASNGSCSSSNSVDFSIAAILPSPTTPTLSSTAPTCSSAGSSTISNYNAGYTYTFTPAGPTVGAGGVISGMVTGTNYTVTTNNGSCNSSASVSFSNGAILPTPVTTVSSNSVCEGGAITLTPTTGGTWVSNNPSVATVTAGGVVSIVNDGSVDFTFTATNTCASTTPSVLVNPNDDASFSYTGNTFCLTGTNPTPTITGTAGGVFTISSPGSINASTGVINLSASGLGTFTVYYNTAILGNPCPKMDSTVITITSAPSAAFSYNVAQACQDATAPVLTFGAGASAGTFSSTPAGLTLNPSNGAITPSTSTAGTYTIYNDIAASGGCAAAKDSTTIEILQLDDASFSYVTGATYCVTGTDPTATVSGTSGGTFTISGVGVIDASTGEIDLSASGLGTFTVYYNTPSGNACPHLDSTTITITSAPTAGFSYDVAQVCQDATAPVLTMNPGASVGVFSSTPVGLNLNTTNGAITLPSTAGVYTVYNTVAAAGGCATAIDSTTIEILQLDDASFSYLTGATYCLTGTDPIATVSGTTGGVFTISGVGVIDASTGEIDLSASGLGTFTVYYNTPAGNACPQVDSVTVNIVDAPGASFTYNTPFCEGNANEFPTFVGNNFAGVFSSNPSGVVFVSTTTGEINLATTPAGTYMIYNNLVASGGCAAALDSFEITINPSYNLQETVAVCSGGSYTFPDGTTQTNITAQVIYNSNLTTGLGCDSIVETTVNVNPTPFTQETVAICNGGSYTFPDGTTQTNITAQVIYNSNLTTGLGCDSIVETTVNVNPIPFTQETGFVCSGGSYTFPDGTTQTNITAQVVYNSTLVSALGCDSIVETTVNVNPQLSATPDATTPICLGSPIVLTATSSGNGVITWYSDAAGTTVIGTGSPCTPAPTVTTPGLYTYYVNEVGTCSSTIVPVNQLIGGVIASIGATPSSGFMPLDVVFTNGSTTGPTVTYTWNFGDGTPTSNQNEPTHTYTNLGNYTATLTVSDGVCSATASIIIEVIGQSSILIPNVFTPNNDGSNDVFTVDGTNLESVEGVIFNRWGQQLFSWNGVKGHWDGRTLAGEECPDGTYFYIIKAKGNDGAIYAKNGAFSLIR